MGGVDSDAPPQGVNLRVLEPPAPLPPRQSSAKLELVESQPAGSSALQPLQHSEGNEREGAWVVGAAHPQGVPGRPPLGADADVPPDIARGFKSDGQGARADGNSRHGDSGDAAPLAPAGLQQPPAGGGHAAGGAPTVQVEKAEQQQQTEEARKKKQVEEEKAEEEKSKKVKALPTGVRPRQLLLPALMPLVMLLPITCIIVPVYFGEDRDQRAEASSQVLCVLPPPPYLAPHVNNETLPPGLQARYLDELSANCSRLSQFVFAGNDTYDPTNPSWRALRGGYAAVQLGITAVDAQLGVASLSVTVKSGPNGGNITDLRGRLTIPREWRLDVDFDNAPNGLITLREGDKTAQRPLATRANAVRSSFRYPFDFYNASVQIVSSLHNGNETQFTPLPLFLNFSTNTLASSGWYLYMVPSAHWYDQVEADGTTYLSFSITLKRNSFVKFYSIMILTGMWLVTSATCTYAVDVSQLRPRNIIATDATMTASILFAMNGIRSVMPGVPPVGILIDYVGFVWLIMFLMVAFVMMVGRLVTQHVCPHPTLYDRLLRTQPWRQHLEDLERHKKQQEGGKVS